MSLTRYRCLEIVGAVHEEARIPQQRCGIRPQVGGVGNNLHFAVDFAQVRRGGHGFGQHLLGVLLRVQRLPLEIGRLHEVAVHQG